MTDRSTFAAGEAPDGTWSRPLSRALWAVLLLGVVIGWFARQPALTTGGDEATYVILSESLDQGQYRDEFVLGTPRHAKYPPGMPAWLLVLRHTLGDSPDVSVSVNEIACRDPACPGVETIILVMVPGQRARACKVAKILDDVTEADVREAVAAR